MDYRSLQNGSDVRGVALEGVPGQPVNLTPEAASDICRAFVLWLAGRRGCEPQALRIAVGRDSRLTGPALGEAADRGILCAGAGVQNFGMTSTPAMFMSTVLPGFSLTAR